MQKIMFDDERGLNSAAMTGRKNMTRRLEKSLQEINEDSKSPFVNYKFDDYNAKSNTILAKRYFRGHFSRCCELHPRFKVGEVVAVAQSYREIEKEIERDGLPLTLKDSILKTHGYRNKMFVKSEFMPHQIRITDVHIERLQDISDEDCLREGIIRDIMPGFNSAGYEIDVPYYWFNGDDGDSYKYPCEAFAALIDKVSGKGTWDSNPWVYVYEFEKVK